jgi:hypothetical protein
VKGKSLAVAGIVGLTLLVGTGSAQAATKPHRFANCTAMHKAFKHGVGLPTAKDKVRGKTKPVATFYKSKAWYVLNRGLDRDKDGIACEQR